MIFSSCDRHEVTNMSHLYSKACLSSIFHATFTAYQFMVKMGVINGDGALYLFADYYTGMIE